MPEHAHWLHDLETSVVGTFARLSKQSLDRFQLIAQLREARKTKLQMRKQVFLRRRRVLAAQRAVDALQRAEEARIRKAVAADDMKTFLVDLRRHAAAWT